MRVIKYLLLLIMGSHLFFSELLLAEATNQVFLQLERGSLEFTLSQVASNDQSLGAYNIDVKSLAGKTIPQISSYVLEQPARLVIEIQDRVFDKDENVYLSDNNLAMLHFESEAKISKLVLDLEASSIFDLDELKTKASYQLAFTILPAAVEVHKRIDSRLFEKKEQTKFNKSKVDNDAGTKFEETDLTMPSLEELESYLLPASPKNKVFAKKTAGRNFKADREKLSEAAEVIKGNSKLVLKEKSHSIFWLLIPLCAGLFGAYYYYQRHQRILRAVEFRSAFRRLVRLNHNSEVYNSHPEALEIEHINSLAMQGLNSATQTKVSSELKLDLDRLLEQSTY
jgi:hypothetical protein